MRPLATLVVVSWIPLSYSEARGFISHYSIHYSPVTSEKRRQEVDAFNQTVPGMDTNATRIEGLDTNTDYIVQVSATNGAGTSKLSAAVRATVPIKGTYVHIMLLQDVVNDIHTPLLAPGFSIGHFLRKKSVYFTL